MKPAIACVALSLVLPSALAANAAASSVPPTAQQDVFCMVKTLRGMPGIDRVKSGFSKEATSGSPAGWRHRFVKYRFIDKVGLEYNVRFDGVINGALSGHEWAYNATLPNGVTGAGPDGRPSEVNDWGTGRVIDNWKARCGVAAGALSF